MIGATDIVASRKISREAQDRFSLRSQQPIEEAENAGRFAGEIVLVTTTMAVSRRDRIGAHRAGLIVIHTTGLLSSKRTASA